jgi:hypothetical protein
VSDQRVMNRWRKGHRICAAIGRLLYRSLTGWQFHLDFPRAFRRHDRR